MIFTIIIGIILVIVLSRFKQLRQSVQGEFFCAVMYIIEILQCVFKQTIRIFSKNAVLSVILMILIPFCDFVCLLCNFSGWKIDSTGNAEFSNGVFRGEIKGATGIFNGDLIGGKVYFSSLGLYGLHSGSTEMVTYKPRFSTPERNVLQSARFEIECAKSDFFLNISIKVGSAGDTNSYNNVSIGIYYKKNGSVSTTDYTDYRYQSSRVKVGESIALNLSTNISIENPNEYIEVLFTCSTNGIPLSPVGEASLGISERNKYLKSCIEIIEL